MSKGKYFKAVSSHMIFLKSFPKSHSCVTIKCSTMCGIELSDSRGEQAWECLLELKLLKGLWH